MDLEYFGVYYNKVMFYLSTNQNKDVVKHYPDEGNKNEIIVNSKIPNFHLLSSDTKKIQGHSFGTFVKDVSLVFLK